RRRVNRQRRLPATAAARRPFAFRASHDMASPQAPAPGEVRLDLWLWAARFFRTRSLAKQAVAGGKVEVDGQRAKPARTLRGGESLRIERAGELLEVVVAGLSDVRGPAPVAQ